MTTSALREIRSKGDLLERQLYKDSAFASAFDLYPVTWVKYVLSARRPGSLWVEGAWKSFAELHYPPSSDAGVSGWLRKNCCVSYVRD
jgi:hypothetical protein